jgi:phosphoglycolate phosphatase
MRLVLFDIDGTLIHSGGAGMTAFCRGLRQVFNIPADREIISPDGKTDPLIAREFLAHFGHESLWTADSSATLFSCYLTCLEEEMERARASHLVRVLPGVRQILQQLAAHPAFALGLVTGNLEQGARIKLAAADLDRYFRFGGYGSDSENRTEVVRMAIARGACHVAPKPVEASFVIGDTPLDVVHGRAAGATAIAVATARYTIKDLRACAPDLLVPDLTDTQTIIEFLTGATRSFEPRP